MRDWIREFHIASVPQATSKSATASPNRVVGRTSPRRSRVWRNRNDFEFELNIAVINSSEGINLHDSASKSFLAHSIQSLFQHPYFNIPISTYLVADAPP